MSSRSTSRWNGSAHAADGVAESQRSMAPNAAGPDCSSRSPKRSALFALLRLTEPLQRSKLVRRVLPWMVNRRRGNGGLIGVFAQQDLRLNIRRQRMLGSDAPARSDDDHEERCERRADDQADHELDHARMVPNGMMHRSQP